VPPSGVQTQNNNVGTIEYSKEFLNSITCKSIIWVIKESYKEGNKISESK
jgi:hypothetical protein